MAQSIWFVPKGVYRSEGEGPEYAEVTQPVLTRALYEKAGEGLTPPDQPWTTITQTANWYKLRIHNVENLTVKELADWRFLGARAEAEGAGDIVALNLYDAFWDSYNPITE